MSRSPAVKPRIKDLACALFEVAPVLALIFAVTFLIGVGAKFADEIGAGFVALSIACCALGGLIRKRAAIEKAISEQVQKRTQGS